MVEESADKSYELCLINIHGQFRLVCGKQLKYVLVLSYGGVLFWIRSQHFF